MAIYSTLAPVTGFTTAVVHTVNSEYIVSVRPSGVTVICEDGAILHGTDAYGMTEGARLFVRDNDRDLTVLRTSTIREVVLADYYEERVGR